MCTRHAFIAMSYTRVDDRPLCVKCPCWPLTIRSLRCAKVIAWDEQSAVMSLPRVSARARNNNNDAFSNNERLRNLADTSPRAASDASNTQSPRVSRTYATSRSMLRARAFEVITYVDSTLYDVTRIRLREQIAATRAIPKDKRKYSWTLLIILPAKDSEGLALVSRPQLVALRIPQNKLVKILRND